MNLASYYADALRAIAQDLEERKVEIFDLRSEADAFLLQARGSEKWAFGSFKGLGLQKLLETLGIQDKSRDDLSADRFDSGFTLQYTPDEIERLKKSGEARRGTSKGPLELVNLSQTLRTVGAYIDRKGGRLARLTKFIDSAGNHSLRIQYETYTGERKEEERTLSSLYALSVHMYKQRQKHSVVIPPLQ